MSRDIFRIFKPDGKSEDPVAKRRGQLRRAQQTHRRKEKYTRCLEQQLAQAALRENGLTQEVERLRGTTDALMSYLSQQGIEVPPGLSLGSARGEVHTQYSPLNGGHTPNSFNMVTPTALDTNRHSPQNSDLARIRMEFVLRLESICLGHIHGDPNQPDDPHGHTFTATMMLESCNMPHNDKTPQAAPVAILDRLLRLSPELCPGTEQTPVQIWEHIQNQPYSGQIDAQRLHLLADKLRDAAKCHGFGAVVESAMVDKLLLETVRRSGFKP
uniref:BZIP domain-containing protein n=1 Tax=Bionectria ochroleuca TaxID=29856 RepID=A0A0B7KM49_BIOOC